MTRRVILSEAKDLNDCHSERSEESEKSMKEYFVYIMTNRKNGVLYTGISNNLERRVYEHKHKLVPGFTSKYNCKRLVYYDSNSNVRGAIEREKQIKGWLRKKKIALIESMNPEWRDLSEEWDK